MKDNQLLNAETTNEITDQEERKRLFSKLWNIQDSLECCQTTIKQAAKTIDLINNQAQGTLYTYYRDIQKQAQDEGKEPEQTFSYKYYEELDIMNNIISRYLQEVFTELDEIESDIQEMKGIANEI